MFSFSINKICVMRFIAFFVIILFGGVSASAVHDYGDALTKSILFFEGQRSGKLPSTQRLTWRKDSGLADGQDKGVDLTGGYYDAGDNVKYSFPMAFTTTVLAWGVIQYGDYMGSDMAPSLEAIRWATDFFLKATAQPGVVYAMVGDPHGDHNCWERPEDMDTPRTAYAVTTTAPGSEVAAEIAAALAAASLAFRKYGDEEYSLVLSRRAPQVFEFADRYRGSYNDSIGYAVCPFYCDFNGYVDELLWAATWLYKATGQQQYKDYVIQNINSNFKQQIEASILQFGWDAKNAGVTVLVSQDILMNKLQETTPFLPYADSFVCSIMPESPTRSVIISPGGLLSELGGANLQNTASRSFLLLMYAQYLQNSSHEVKCGDTIISPTRLINFTKTQVDYILGDNPLNLSYMVGYGEKFPLRPHHRGSSIPSINQHPEHIECKAGTPFYESQGPNPNELTGAVVGGPDTNDLFEDNRSDPAKLEPCTYINAPLVGMFAYFKAHSR